MMKNQYWTRIRVALALAVASVLCTAAAERRPNVIIILADDLGWADLACYGHAFHETPNLDRLASRGMRFTSAYAASCVCSPTRSSIMTGKYPARNDLTIWLGGRGGAPAVDHMALAETTIAEALKAHGYATAHVGKWHLGGAPYEPQHQGFDLNIAGTHAGSPAGGYFLPNRMKLENMTPGTYLTDRLTDECLDVIGKWRARPFFIYMSYHTVHTPIQGRKDLVDHYRAKLKPGDSYNPTYAAMLHCLDENVGRIVAKLDELKLADDTLLLFFSDNGGFSHSRGRKNSVTTNLPLRLGKGYCYEGGHREPMIVSYPRLVKPGTLCDIPVVSTDFYPTILDLAGAPPLPEQHADGVSLVPLLTDARAEFARDTIYWHYPHNSPQGGKPSGALREGDWKLIEFFNTGKVELYNLARDLGETIDLADTHPAMVKELLQKLRTWRTSVDAKMPPPPGSKPQEARRPSAPSMPKPTPSFPGFEQLIDVAVSKHDMGCQLAAKETGLALKEPHEPLTGRVTFKTQMTPLQNAPSNGFLVFGAKQGAADQVTCGIFIGGRYAAIFEGTYPSPDTARVDRVPVSRKAYDITVTVDTDADTVEMDLNGTRVSKALTKPIDAIRTYGYGVIRTRSAFGEITVSR